MYEYKIYYWKLKYVIKLLRNKNNRLKTNHRGTNQKHYKKSTLIL